jgi:hypothetical protein
MRRIAILIVAGLSVVVVPPAAAQLPEDPLPEVPDLPDVEVPELPGDDGGGGGGGGGSDPVPSIGIPSTDGGSDGGSSGGSSGGGGDSGSGGGGGGSGSGGGSSSGGGGGLGSGAGSGLEDCPCAPPTIGYPVANTCQTEDGARSDAETGLVVSYSDSSSGGGADGTAGGVLGASGEDALEPPIVDGGPLGDNSAPKLVVAAVFALIGLGLLVGIAGGLKALHGRQSFP